MDNTGNATYFADTALKRSKRLVPHSAAYLAKAAVLVHEKKFAEALRMYSEALRTDPKRCDSSVRVGIGLCCYHLGDKDKALAAFERALQLEPTNAEALVATALLKGEKAHAKTIETGATHARAKTAFLK